MSILLGPFLKFQTCENDVFRASVLVVSSDDCPPRLTISDGRASKGYSLDKYKSRYFYRYDLEIPQSRNEQTVTYTVADNEYNFFIPGIDTDWRWAFFSCNGFSNDVTPEDQKEKYGGDQVLWEDVLQQHKARPFHIMVGGGDQLYCDDVFIESSRLREWNELGTMQEKQDAIMDEEMRDQIENYYFNNYVRFFGQGLFAEAMKEVPYTYCIDDHDIFDGYGSYPENLRTSSVISGIGEVGFRFYLLFQQHTTPNRAQEHGFVGKVPQSYVSSMGRKAALMVLDGRCERTEAIIADSETYDVLLDKAYKLPKSVEHMFVVLGVPIVYPRMTFAEGVLDYLTVEEGSAFSFVTNFLRKTGAVGQVVNQMGQPELKDDLGDHWTTDEHADERKAFIQRLQQFAKERCVRISFIAGDVHCCSAGYLKSKDDSVPKEEDYRYMVQITSSGIVNAPPPSVVIDALHRNAVTYDLDADTKEEMFELFKKDVDDTDLEEKNKLVNRRNWCKVTHNEDQSVDCSIRVEKVDHDGCVGYTVVVPPLRLSGHNKGKQESQGYGRRDDDHEHERRRESDY